MSTGDGAVSDTVLWDPDTNELASAATTEVYPDVQGVEATHPTSKLALVGLEDRNCWGMVDYSAAPTRLFESSGCLFTLWDAALSPSGTQVAIAEALPGPQASAHRSAWDVTISVFESRRGEHRASIPFVAPVQLWWESDSTLLVLSNPAPGRYQVDRCSGDLVCEVLWAQNGIGDGHRETPGDAPRAWLVEER